MKRAILFAIPLVFPLALASVTAAAAQSTGNAALALAAIVGSASPKLSPAERAVLAHFLDGDTHAPLVVGTTRLTVSADRITCRMGDVDIGLHDCELVFDGRTIKRSGRAGQELLSALQENGVEADGAAGTIYYSVAPLTCMIDAKEVEDHDGGGASCSFTNGR
jgi:hypothetical protein